ncbi:MAG: CubicO group peptidase (beta-lactamase class C family) [Algoriphagus sp.]|jgi:CubicO group peptidase (beta-lactamase class C family)
MKGPKIKYFLVFLILWAFGFLSWEWWNSYPKISLAVLKSAAGFEGKIDSILYQAINEYRLPGVSLALVKEGKLVYMNALGFENLRTKAPLNPTSTIPVASISKLFTALTIANKALSTDLEANTSLKNRSNTLFPPLSLSQLLEHRSGLKSEYSIRSRLFRKLKTGLKDWGTAYMEKLKFETINSAPYFYSDLNYDLLGYWLERQSEITFQNQVSENIFTSAGMEQSFFMDLNSADTLSISGYQHTFLWKRLEENQLKLRILPSPSSGLLTSTKDMSIALIHLLRGDMGNFQEELAWLNDQENAKLLGFQKIKILDSDWIGHYGGQAGYSSFFFFSKNEDTGIFLFFNLKDPADYRLDLSKKILVQLLQK